MGALMTLLGILLWLVLQWRPTRWLHQHPGRVLPGEIVVCKDAPMKDDYEVIVQYRLRDLDGKVLEGESAPVSRVDLFNDANKPAPGAAVLIYFVNSEKHWVL